MGEHREHANQSATGKRRKYFNHLKREETSRPANFGRTGRGELAVGYSVWLDARVASSMALA